jgi:hypothetical protein
MRYVIFCAALCLSISTFGAEIKINFGDDTIGQAPTNFHAVLAGDGQPGEWKIISDAVPSAFAPLTDRAPVTAHQNVLAQTSQDTTDSRYPMFIYDGEIFQNFTLTTHFKIVSGVNEQMAGIVFNFQNASNFFVVRASALGKNLRCYPVVNGELNTPIGPALDVTTNVWHDLIVTREGNRLVCSLDGVAAIKLVDLGVANAPGKIGFWTKSDAVSYFGDTVIEYQPRIPVAQALVNNLMEQQPRILTLRLYTLDDRGQPRVVGSNDPKEIGQPGEDAEKDALNDGTVSFGKSPGVVAVTLPLRDRNGDPIAAVRVRLHSFFGETQENAVTRATQIVKLMQAQVTAADDLRQ